MLELTDNSVHLTITSPPYWQLKDYGSPDQIGYNDSYEEYINNLNLVWQECYRVLYPGCRLCVNIGDQFARAAYYGRYKVIPIREEIIKFCENAGFDYMGAIIWQKVTTSNTTGGGVQMGSYPYPRNGILKIDYEFIITFKKPGVAPKPAKEIKEQSKLTSEEWNTFFASHWNFSGVKQDSHIAMFPEELPKRLIKMFSFVGDTILDPFAGSGTTNLAAKKLQRSSAGYEINKDFITVIKDKLQFDQNNLDETTYESVTQEPLINIEKEIRNLPYIFSDPHKFNKKVDPKKLQFGSKIDINGGKKREELFKVKEILSPTKIRLNNDLTIRLLGIKEIPGLSEKAAAFLESKTKNKKVYLKYDRIKYDKNNNLLCYLYLENKTFVNAHLLKTGLVGVDKKSDFKHKNKFFSLIPHKG